LSASMALLTKYMVLSAIAVTLTTSDMEYRYHSDDLDSDNRPPACYQLTYRGCRYWSCYKIHLREYFEQLLSYQPIYNQRR